MALKMKPDDVLDFRNALEPLTLKMTSDDDPYSQESLPLASIAISIKRIADSLDRLVELEENK